MTMSAMQIEGSSVMGAVLGTQNQLAAELGGDANAQVAAMMLVHARDKGENLRTMRRAERENLRLHQEKQVQSMRSKAEENYAAARIAAYGKMVDGACSVAGGVATCCESEALASGLSGAGKIASAYTDGVSALHSRKAAYKEVEATAAEHLATESKQRLEDLRDEQFEMQKLTRTALDFLRGVQSSQEQIDRALNRA
jgi:hypothetical protein